MGKKRLIDMEGILFDSEISSLGMDGCLLYARLICLAEDWGGIELNPGNLRLQMGGLQGTFTSKRILAVINSLIELKKIVPYEHDGKRYGWLKNFLKYQHLEFPKAPCLPLPKWVKWHPKAGFQGSKQHYEILYDSATDVEPPLNHGSTTVQRIEENRREEKRIKTYNVGFSKCKNPTACVFFDKLWELHHYGSKKVATEEIDRLKPNEGLQSLMLDALKEQVGRRQRFREQGEWISPLPHLSRWIKQRLWEMDERAEDERLEDLDGDEEEDYV